MFMGSSVEPRPDRIPWVLRVLCDEDLEILYAQPEIDTTQECFAECDEWINEFIRSYEMNENLCLVPQCGEVRSCTTSSETQVCNSDREEQQEQHQIQSEVKENSLPIEMETNTCTPIDVSSILSGNQTQIDQNKAVVEEIHFSDNVPQPIKEEVVKTEPAQSNLTYNIQNNAMEPNKDPHSEKNVVVVEEGNLSGDKYVSSLQTTKQKDKCDAVLDDAMSMFHECGLLINETPLEDIVEVFKNLSGYVPQTFQKEDMINTEQTQNEVTNYNYPYKFNDRSLPKSEKSEAAFVEDNIPRSIQKEVTTWPEKKEAAGVNITGNVSKPTMKEGQSKFTNPNHAYAMGSNTYNPFNERSFLKNISQQDTNETVVDNDYFSGYVPRPIKEEAGCMTQTYLNNNKMLTHGLPRNISGLGKNEATVDSDNFPGTVPKLTKEGVAPTNQGKGKLLNPYAYAFRRWGNLQRNNTRPEANQTGFHESYFSGDVPRPINCSLPKNISWSNKNETAFDRGYFSGGVPKLVKEDVTPQGNFTNPNNYYAMGPNTYNSSMGRNLPRNNSRPETNRVGFDKGHFSGYVPIPNQQKMMNQTQNKHEYPNRSFGMKPSPYNPFPVPKWPGNIPRLNNKKIQNVEHVPTYKPPTIGLQRNQSKSFSKEEMTFPRPIQSKSYNPNEPRNEAYSGAANGPFYGHRPT